MPPKPKTSEDDALKDEERTPVIESEEQSEISEAALADNPPMAPEPPVVHTVTGQQVRLEPLLSLEMFVHAGALTPVTRAALTAWMKAHGHEPTLYRTYLAWMGLYQATLAHVVM